MAKNEKTTYPGNSKGFKKGSEPKKFGPADLPTSKDEEKNKIGATPEAQESKNKPGVTESVLDYKNKDQLALTNAYMPNKKSNEVNKSMFDKISDFPTSVGGVSRPNTIE